MTNSKKTKVVYSNDEYVAKLLEFLNWVLKKLNKEPIDDVRKFKNIKRQEIIDIDIDKTHDEWYNILFPVFSKYKFRYSYRKETRSYIISVIRKACKEFGYKLIGYEKKKNINNFVNSHIEYTIE